jgi:peptidoglycan/LPS O-acetylase OafA/YrhL
LTAVKNNNSKHISGIDGLRALAVLAVMFYHLDFSMLPGGFTGVDIFFVISGFVVSYSLSQHRHESLSQFILFFYARRVLRILPALLFCIIITAFLTICFVPESWLSDSIMLSGKAAIFGLSNFILVWQNDGYFAPQAASNPFTHTWSLAVEEQFYFIFPPLFYLWTIRLKSVNKRSLISSHAIGILAISSLLYCIYASKYATEHAYYFIFSRFWQLACGVLLFQLLQNKTFTDRFLKLKNLPVTIGLISILLAFLYADKTSFPFPWGLLPVIGTALLIAHLVLAEPTNRVSTLFSRPIIRWIGLLSYSLYLWHWPIYTILRWTIGLETIFQYTLAILLTVAMGMISYYLIENKVRIFIKINAKPKRVIFGGVMASLFIFLVFSGALNQKQLISQSNTRNTQDWYPYSYHHGLSKEQINLYSANPDKQLFVLGDSHAGAYATMIKSESLQLGNKYFNFNKGGCPSLPFHIENQTPECETFISTSLSRIYELAKKGDVVFLPSLRLSRFSNQDKNPDFDSVLITHSKLTKGDVFRKNQDSARNLVEQLTASGLIVILEAPLPLLKSPPFRCSDWFNKMNPICERGLSVSRMFLETYREPIFTFFTELAAKNPNVYLWDPLPIVCEEELCSAFRDNKPLFFDGDHLSGFGNRVLAPSFTNLLTDIWHLELKSASE